MKGKHAKLTTVVEELEENLQREREEVEVLQMSLKEKEITCVKNMEEAHKGITQKKFEEAEEMLSGLLGASNLRTSYTQSNQARKLLEKVQKILAKESDGLTR